MSTLHSVAGSLIAAANIYGWRLDAILLSGLLWMLTVTYHQVVIPSRLTVARQAH